MNPETISPCLAGFDTWNDRDILEALWQGQAGALAAVRAVLPALALAARDVANRLEVGGRLIFAGAGTSGQLAALEAAELPVTFGWPQDRILSLVPGQPPISDAGEDDADHAAGLMAALRISPLDVVIAVAASGDTPFTCAAAEHAFRDGALVVALFNKADSRLGDKAHHGVFLDTGSEIPAGSTRMNAGTGQKAALNLLSVLVMTRLGHVHDGLMVDLMPNRPKFRRRAIRIIATICECADSQAERLLLQAGGNIKQAVLMAHGCDRGEAETIMARNGGNLRKALAAVMHGVEGDARPNN